MTDSLFLLSEHDAIRRATPMEIGRIVPWSDTATPCTLCWAVYRMSHLYHYG